MNRRLLKLVGVPAVVASAALLAACSPGSSDSAKTSSDGTKKVTIQIDGAAVPYYAPLYAAKEQGYFADAGLDVEFTYAQGSDIVKNVASGNVDFGFPNGDSVVTAYGKGIKTKVVHTTYQQGIGSLLSQSSSKINSPADLKGKSVAVTDLGSPNYIQLQAMLQSAGLKLTDVKVRTLGTGVIVDALKNGQVDAIVFSRLRYYALQSAGVNVNQILSDKYLPSFGNVVIAGEALVKDNPGTVKAFDKALNQGIEYTVKNPRNAVDMSVKKYAASFKGQEKEITTIIEDLFTKSLWQSENTQKNGLGSPDLVRWQQTIDSQKQFKLLDKSFDASDLVVEPNGLG
ncbi:ABC transporter substrate-binding protein [Streptomyces sp. NPDC091377]|uniref:ABC transporter substrate-binding protein n=1 Tax=Streptomyces sp. NPDC091377 TaxID=3365995 RepID=UPI00382814CA